MIESPLGTIVIAGGGTAGWMAAAALSQVVDTSATSIVLVESEEIGTVGVGEATIPPIKSFNAMLGIDENEMLSATQGSFKLGIEFAGWGAAGESYIHPFGTYGREVGGIKFHQLWLKLRSEGLTAPYGDFCLSAMAASGGKFDRPSADPHSPLSLIDYAFHFDARLYAAFLRALAEGNGVTRVEGKIGDVEQRAEDGFIAALALTDGRRVEGDFFLDCTGFRSLLLGQALGSRFIDWSQWLPCDRAVAMPSARLADMPPLTRATAHHCGWQWRIPLQHRTGNGLVYSSRLVSDDEAAHLLRNNIEGEAFADPLFIGFTPGRRESAWIKNCVGLGLAGGFLEPLESTSIHLVQSGLSKLISLFPDARHAANERAEYNRLNALQWDYIRDFIILHYKVNRRGDSELWRQCAAMDVPETLDRKLGLFAGSGRMFRYDDELFTDPNWSAVMIGQGLIPERYDPLADALDPAALQKLAKDITGLFRHIVPQMPTHAQYLARHCPGKPM
jgi:tryptophan 7-halogenase